MGESNFLDSIIETGHNVVIPVAWEYQIAVFLSL
jgi:hypothetical protein